MTARPATIHDATAMAVIYNQGIEDRTATFETQPRNPADLEGWFETTGLNGPYPIAVVETVDTTVIAFAATSAYRPRVCYRGVAEVSVYVHRDFRGQGAGRLALCELIRLAQAAGFWKLLSRVFPENHASRALIATLGFREVGFYEKHGCLDGVWRDVVIVERLIPVNLT